MLFGAYNNNKVANAYLFSGNNLEEMDVAAREFFGLLNSKKSDVNISHDLVEVRPEGKKGIIKIDRVREMKDRIKFGPSTADIMIFHVSSIDSIEAAGANCFLKELEEPPNNVVFIMTTTKEHAVPKTIISRAQKVLFTNNADVPDLVDGPAENADIFELSQYSKSITESSERSDIEKSLEGLLVKYWNLRLPAKARIVMEALRSVKMMGNVRLSADVMTLRLGGHLK